MWRGDELKQRARDGLSRYYGYGLLVTFVAGLLGVKGGAGTGVNFSAYQGRHGVNLSSALGQPFAMGIVLLVWMVIGAVFTAAVLLGILVSNVIEVGKCRYFTISTMKGDNAGFGELFGNFKNGRYLNTVKIQFLRKLYEGLWSLLLVIPGIIKHYEYYMIPYLVAEYPEMDSSEAFRLSREMMEGNKLDTFILELSFLGWYLLGLLACGVGMIFVDPYREAALGELYLTLREEKLGIPRNRPHMPDRDGAVYTQYVE